MLRISINFSCENSTLACLLPKNKISQSLGEHRKSLIELIRANCDELPTLFRNTRPHFNASIWFLAFSVNACTCPHYLRRAQILVNAFRPLLAHVHFNVKLMIVSEWRCSSAGCIPTPVRCIYTHSSRRQSNRRSRRLAQVWAI